MRTTTGYHFDHCDVGSVNRKWPRHPEVEIHFETHRVGGQGDQISLYVENLDAKRLCKGLLNIIGDDHEFHKELEQMMKIQRMPE